MASQLSIAAAPPAQLSKLVTRKPRPLPTKGIARFFWWLVEVVRTSDSELLRSCGLDALVRGATPSSHGPFCRVAFRQTAGPRGPCKAQRTRQAAHSSITNGCSSSCCFVLLLRAFCLRYLCCR